jgi:hypothetical protein
MPSGATRVRVLGKYNLANTATAEKETVVAAIRFIPSVGGRADVFASGGDIAEGKYFIGTACWDAQEAERFRVLRLCSRGRPQTECTVVEGSVMGTRAACPAADLRGEDAPPSGTPDDLTQEPEAPTEAEPVPADVIADF